MSEEEKVKQVPVDELRTFEGRCRNLFTIKDKSKKKVNLEFHQSQKIIDEIVEQEFDRNKRERGHRQCRLIVLKPRQMGATTYFAARFMDMLMNVEGTEGVTMAHNTDTTELIYKIYKRIYDHLPDSVIPTQDGKPLTNEEGEKIKIETKPTTEHYSGKQIAFKENDTYSVIQTAGSKDDAGKGITPLYLHLSECANYPDYSATVTSIMPSVPKFSDNVMIVLESTANGVTGKGEGFYKAWKQSTKEWERYQNGDSQTFGGYRPVFIPWYMIEEYRLPLYGGKMESIDQIDFGSPEEKKKFLQKEKHLKEGVVNPLTGKTVQLDDEQLNWYRWIIKEDCEYDYNTAKRYYPTWPDEAFVSSTQCFFDSIKLTEVKNKYAQDGQPDFELGELEWNDETAELEFVESAIGNFKVWEHPDPQWEGRYIASADPARNYEDGDYGVIMVKDRLEEKIVAKWYGKVDQDVFADKLVEIGLYYNEAFLVPESNLDTVVELIKPDGYNPYVGEIYYNDRGNKVKYGYLTTGSSRRYMLDTYKAWLRDNPNGYEVLMDNDIIDEHLSFVKKTNKRSGDGVKYEADSGNHDDLVMAHALAHIGDVMWEESPQKYERENIHEVVSKPRGRKRKGMKQSELGRSVF